MVLKLLHSFANLRAVGSISVLLAVIVTAQAADLQPASTIQIAVKAYLETLHGEGSHPVEVSVGNIDSRLQLKACAVPLEVSIPSGYRRVGNTTAGVTCTTPQSWTIYVPARVRQYAPVLVTTKSLQRGAMLRLSDLETDRRDVAALRAGYVSDPAELAGMRLKRSVRAGTLITPQMFEAVPMVERGRQVTVVAGSPTLRVTASGTALENGGRGENVRIRSSASDRVLEGVVMAPNEVRVGSFR